MVSIQFPLGTIGKQIFFTISIEVSKSPWILLFDDCPLQELPYLFTLTSLWFYLNKVPVKKQCSGKPDEAHALKRKERRTVITIEENKALDSHPQNIREIEFKFNFYTC